MTCDVTVFDQDDWVVIYFGERRVYNDHPDWRKILNLCPYEDIGTIMSYEIANDYQFPENYFHIEWDKVEGEKPDR